MTASESLIGQLVSVNVGLPRTVGWKGTSVTTGIFKESVEFRVPLRTLNLDGDGQADLTVHGGPDKAVYAYPAEHYDYWNPLLGGQPLPWGMFGENLTTRGLLEDTVNIGDRFRLGTAELRVTGPRVPCFKLGLKFGRDDMIKRFLLSRRSGFYLRVLQEGDVAAGDVIELVERDPGRVTVADINRLYLREYESPQELQRAVDIESLPESWRGYFRAILERASG